MRKLSEIIKYDLSRQNKRRLKTFDEYLYENKIPEGLVTDNDIFNYRIQNVWPSDTVNDTYEDWFNETLTPHSKDMLIKSIEFILGDYCEAINDNPSSKENYQSKGSVVFYVRPDCPIFDEPDADFLTSFELADCSMADEIYNVLEFRNYFISEIQYLAEHKLFALFIESYFTTDASKDIEANGNILYHITKRKNLNDILRCGLRPKAGKRPYEGGYRFFPKRLFLIGNNPNIKNDIRNVIKDKKFKERGIDYVILQIDLENHNIGLWYDDASNNKFNVYTLELIPPKLIKEVSFDEIS